MPLSSINQVKGQISSKGQEKDAVDRGRVGPLERFGRARTYCPWILLPRIQYLPRCCRMNKRTVDLAIYGWATFTLHVRKWCEKHVTFDRRRRIYLQRRLLAVAVLRPPVVARHGNIFRLDLTPRHPLLEVQAHNDALYPRKLQAELLHTDIGKKCHF
jgi:hypothetical protein